ncbi:MAG: hypothetical protein WBB37_04675 [bacterium]
MVRTIVCVFFLASTLGWCQVTWEIEHIDSIPEYSQYIFNSLTLDQYDNPHIVFADSGLRCVNYAVKYDSIWYTEAIDTCFVLYYGVSIAVDHIDDPHLCYCGRDTSQDKTYLLYAHKSSSIWNIDTVDVINGWLGNWFWDITSSIDLDTCGLPGIAYIAWNVPDSIHYIKYAHYTGVIWDTSVVEYDTIYANLRKAPSDWSPSLKFSSQNNPIIAFQQHFAPYCTLKVASYDMQNNQWDKTCLTPFPDASIPVSLALTTQDYPCVAHDGYGFLVYTWYDGAEWHSEGVLGYALLDTRVALDLDSNDDPHICYNAGAMTSWAGYCYKKNSSWHLCGRIDSTAMSWSSFIGIAIDSNDQPHVSYGKYDYIINKYYMAYAKGYVTSVDELEISASHRMFLKCYPTVTADKCNIEFFLCEPDHISLSIYDCMGRLLDAIRYDNTIAGMNTIIVPFEKYPRGVYILYLKTSSDHACIKIIKT